MVYVRCTVIVGSTIIVQLGGRSKRYEPWTILSRAQKAAERTKMAYEKVGTRPSTEGEGAEGSVLGLDNSRVAGSNSVWKLTPKERRLDPITNKDLDLSHLQPPVPKESLERLD